MIEIYWDFWMGGLAIAAIAFLITLLTGQFIGVTKGYASICSIVSKRPFFHRKEMGGPFGFRTLFAVGIMIGGLLAALTTEGVWNPSFDYGWFDKLFGDNLAAKAGLLIFGGACWGYGARLADGCTSGNAIGGLSKGSLASLVTTCGFMISGICATFLINYLLGGL